MLESLPAIVAAAVSAGAAAGLKDTATQVVTDAYRKLKTMIAHRYPAVDLTPVEQRPASLPRRAVLAEDLAEAGVLDDAELLSTARELIAIVRAHEASVGAAVGVDLERIQADALRIGQIESTGTGVRVVDGTIDGAIEIVNVRAGRQDPPDPPAARR